MLNNLSLNQRPRDNALEIVQRCQGVGKGPSNALVLVLKGLEDELVDDADLATLRSFTERLLSEAVIGIPEVSSSEPRLVREAISSTSKLSMGYGSVSILNRVALVRAVQEETSKAKFSTGCLIGTEWVLTSGHGVHEATPREVLLVFSEMDPVKKTPIRQEVLIPVFECFNPYEVDKKMDGALLHLDLRDTQIAEKVQRLAEISGQIKRGCNARGKYFCSKGYPIGGEYKTLEGVKGLDSYYFEGRVAPAGGERRELLQLNVTSGGPQESKDWSGVSGAPVMVGSQLVGLVALHGQKFTQTLNAVSLEKLERNKAFKERLDEAWASAKTAEAAQQPSVDARAHDLELWLGQSSYKEAIWAWLFCLDENEPREYTREQVEERFCASSLIDVLDSVSCLVEELKEKYEDKAQNRARNLLFNLLPLHPESPECKDIGPEVKEALRIRGQLDLYRTQEKILARRELHLPRGIGSSTIAAIEEGSGVMQAFITIVQDQTNWDEQKAREAIEGSTSHYFSLVKRRIARKKNTDDIERPFFITLFQSKEVSVSILEALRKELNIGVYVKNDQSKKDIRAALGRALVELGATQSDALSPSRENKDSAT